ncbi:MAG: transcriptional regulator [Rhodospirillales bacterium 69-11]|nr:helix-turn-helix transcriptional regulator [Rhodospirillales bacterium]OJW27249.1 MAG: transcriptional regulator [Rhodospirillales bacterium 69-11]
MRHGRPVGEMLRDWRQRRRLSQLDLACEADISTKHLSFLETGRSRPSREMLLHLAERLEVPLRERNLLLSAAGYAPEYPERSLDDPALDSARRGVEALLAAHEPNPALAVDRHWQLVAGNRAVGRLMADVEPTLLRPPVNVLRLSLHPAGLASRIVNLPEWRAHVVQRLRRQIEVSGDPVLSDLLEEIQDYPMPAAGASGGPAQEVPSADAVAVPFRLATIDGVLSFFSTTTVFGTPVEVTLSELAIEAFFPADPETARLMRLQADAPVTRPEVAQEAAD